MHAPFVANRLISMLLLLAGPACQLAQSQSNKAASSEELVVPDTIYDRQPFSFAASHVVEGEVVSVQTVSGEVVQRAPAGKLGRIFLATGLPAGAYLISSGRHSLGKVDIKQAFRDPWDWTGTDGWIPIPIDPVCLPPGPIKINEGFSVLGKGFSANYDDVQVKLSSAGKSETIPVLAATAMQLKLAPGQNVRPGAAELLVTN